MKLIHKGNNFGVRICDNKKTNILESSYHWGEVTCPACLKDKPKNKIKNCGNCYPMDCPVVGLRENTKNFSCNFYKAKR
jgi:hypothetical protein